MKKKSDLELLAPAGTLDVFETAVANGADAVYVGAPAMNARNLAKHFSMAEIAAMTSHAHKNGVKIYLAMNSLLKDREIPELLDTLANLDDIGIDALIIQDLGIMALVRRYFPKLAIHASTLCTAHNSLGVKQLQEMGAKRVVLAREMSLAEISQAAAKTEVELETFVHGAMCFSYSGLCLFSSFLGGKSGLRGRCVQPCRRRYTWQGRGKGKGHGGGYLFSMNDLEGIGLIPELRKAGITSLKLEGRMRSSHYVGSVVKAYRMVLDHEPGDQEVLKEAREILGQAMGRKSETGYFLEPANPRLISPAHSGNIGLFIGKVEKGGGKGVVLTLREPLQAGDRLRLHVEADGERHSFTLRKMRVQGKMVEKAAVGQRPEIELPVTARKGDSLYKVDVKETRSKGQVKSVINPNPFRKKLQDGARLARLAKLVSRISKAVAKQPGTSGGVKRQPPRPGRKKHGAKVRGRRERGSGIRLPIPWWLKVDDLAAVRRLASYEPDRLVVTLTDSLLTRPAQISGLRGQFRDLTLALPTIIEEGRVAAYVRGVPKLIKMGFRDWQIGHISHLQLFPESQRSTLNLFGDYSLNILNSPVLRMYQEMGFKGCQLSMEADRDLLTDLCRTRSAVSKGLTVYGLPPLFTARPTPGFFNYDRVFVSPRGERFVLKKNFGQTIALPDRPFSLLPWLDDLVRMGLNYVVIDLTNMNPAKAGLANILQQHPAKSGRKGPPLSNFNFRGTLS